ncbi:hypothetical protein Poly30_43820 [Planctomycetes bacterium Poly30]|uniref:DUF218 domain-containing protein n=1 Tax=Saltatorellus ferox TaxID=2528018 RepID=A0A518EXM3_9BACT|nr:hypothetical protein Poly30_43820 [Planctomycetes bacterium Poly30]
MKRLVELLIMPPMSLYLGVLCGLCIRFVANRLPEPRPMLRRMGTSLAALSGAVLVALSIPQVAFWLLDSLQTSPAISPTAESIDAEAILVLSGDVDCDPPEFGPDQPGPISLQRCRYAARLSTRTGVPILISGGVLRPDRRAVSLVLRDFVQDELHVPVRWTEERSHTTRENARYSAEILARDGIRRVAVVTHAWHMPRAIEVCKAAGLVVLPAPTAPATPPANLRDAFVPRARSFRDSAWAIHEWIGRLWYRISA